MSGVVVCENDKACRRGAWMNAVRTNSQELPMWRQAWPRQYNAGIDKLSVNTYVTVQISFANMASRLCEKVLAAHVDLVAGQRGMKHLDSSFGGVAQ